MFRQASLAVVLAMLSVPAVAQTTVSSSTSGSGSTSNSGATTSVSNNGNNVGGGSSSSGSRSASTSGSTAASGTSRSISQGGASRSVSQGGYAGVGVTINQGTGAAGDPPAGSAGDPSSTQNLNYSGSFTQRNVPEIIAPNISGGNPCLVGAAGGVAVAGFGATFGGGWEDKGCERRNSAALLNNIGEKAVAVALMCQDDNVRRAFIEAGQPCLADRPPAVVSTVAGPRTSQIDPAVIRRQEPQPNVVAVATKPARPDWCWTSSPQELRSHPECDQK